MELYFDLELEDNISNIMEMDKKSISMINIDDENCFISYDKEWGEAYKLVEELYDHLYKHFNEESQINLVKKCGYEIDKNSLEDILTMDTINNKNILTMVFHGDYCKDDKYAIYHECTGFFTTNDIEECICYETLLRDMDDKEYNALNSKYLETRERLKKINSK